MWYKMMAVAFLTNGLGIFGTRVLTGWGWAEFYKFQYLVFRFRTAVCLTTFLAREDPSGAKRLCDRRIDGSG
jgi:hypothetical protein